jgi:hypothetical protein
MSDSDHESDIVDEAPSIIPIPRNPDIITEEDEKADEYEGKQFKKQTQNNLFLFPPTSRKCSSLVAFSMFVIIRNVFKDVE